MKKVQLKHFLKNSMVMIQNTFKWLSNNKSMYETSVTLNNYKFNSKSSLHSIKRINMYYSRKLECFKGIQEHYYKSIHKRD